MSQGFPTLDTLDAARVCDTRPLAAAAIAAHRPEASAQGVDLDLEATRGTAARLDPDVLRDTLTDLLGHALRDCRPGDRVAVRLARDPGGLSIEVRGRVGGAVASLRYPRNKV